MSDKSKIPFGKCSRDVAYAGKIIDLNLAATKVYHLICVHCDKSHWTTFVGRELLAKLSGLTVRSVSRAINELVKSGLISVTTRGRNNVYTVLTDHQKTIETGRKQGTPVSPIDMPDRGHPYHKQGTQTHPIGDTPVQNRGHTCPTNRVLTEYNKEVTEAADASDAAASSLFISKRDQQEKGQCLKRLGLSSAIYLLKELAEVPPDQFAEVVGKCLAMDDANGAPTGVMINAIRTNWRDVLERLNELGRREVIQSELVKTSAQRKIENREVESVRVKAFMDRELTPVTDALLALLDDRMCEHVMNIARRNCGENTCLFQRALFSEFYDHFSIHGLNAKQVLSVTDKHRKAIEKTERVESHFLQEFVNLGSSGILVANFRRYQFEFATVEKDSYAIVFERTKSSCSGFD